MNFLNPIKFFIRKNSTVKIVKISKGAQLLPEASSVLMQKKPEAGTTLEIKVHTHFSKNLNYYYTK